MSQAFHQVPDLCKRGEKSLRLFKGASEPAPEVLHFFTTKQIARAVQKISCSPCVAKAGQEWALIESLHLSGDLGLLFCEEYH
eukprot:1145963-Pelagomonas_calceolata.AAC.9